MQKIDDSENIKILFIPPYTPEMNPIEQVWAKIREIGWNNRIFNSLEEVIVQLCETIKN
ncbi:transposase [Pilibacter termitis]|uniref:transposase n=1 Tax=Pilibacter termitis TaxID=263852 RepID=UPI0011863EA4